MSLNLTAAGLADHKAWEAAGYALPSYDREAMITRTKESPCWVHFGAGNIFRAFQANTAQELLNNGTFDRGVIVAEGFDTEIIRDMYQPHDNLSILSRKPLLEASQNRWLPIRRILRILPG